MTKSHAGRKGGERLIIFENLSFDPFFNQAFEEVLFETDFDDDVFFLWRNSPAVVVGCYQNICREVKIEALRKENIPVIRRITGGGTVYHDLGNVNYTMILQHQSSADYDRCLTPMIAALNALGIPAHKNRTCDIAIDGQKISGSAQKLAHGRLLHHGTLLFDADLSRLDKITTHHKNEHFQIKGILSDICPVTNICRHLKKPLAIETFMAQLTQQMAENAQPRLLTDDQKARLLALRDEKYTGWEWTWGNTPPFTYEKHGTFCGQPIQIAYQAKRGMISDAQIDCAAIDPKLASELLNRARLDPAELACICQKLAGSHQDELLDLLI